MDAPFSWPGGKKYLKKTLLALIPEHKAYVEVFAGSAKLLFAKERSHWEVLNDVNGDLINFFRVAKHRSADLAEMLEREIIHRARFSELKAAPDAADDLSRALRFAYLAWYAFGGKGEHFAPLHVKHLKNSRTPIRRALDTVRETLDRTAERLQRVLIEQRDFTFILDRYDERETFFYLDPPYTSFNKIARYDAMTAERNRELMDRLAKVRGKFLLSFDDAAEIRAHARRHGFHVRRVKVLYTLAAKGTTAAGELLIANFPLRSRRGE